MLRYQRVIIVRVEIPRSWYLRVEVPKSYIIGKSWHSVNGHNVWASKWWPSWCSWRCATGSHWRPPRPHARPPGGRPPSGSQQDNSPLSSQEDSFKTWSLVTSLLNTSCPLTIISEKCRVGNSFISCSIKSIVFCDRKIDSIMFDLFQRLTRSISSRSIFNVLAEFIFRQKDKITTFICSCLIL